MCVCVKAEKNSFFFTAFLVVKQGGGIPHNLYRTVGGTFFFSNCHIKYMF
jgi:hypothetical protein